MINLINKLIAKEKDKQNISTTFNVNQIKPFFESNGVNIENIGFPNIEYRNNPCMTMAYRIQFKDVKITPVKIDNKVSTIITGKYETQAVASYQDKYDNWHPGNPSHYVFEIKEGKLNLKYIKD